MDRILHINFGFFALTESFVKNIIEKIENFEILLASFWRNEKKYKCRKIWFSLPKPKMYLSIEYFIHRKVARIIREENIKLVHAHFGETGAVVYGYKKFINVPFVVSFYGRDAYVTSRKKIWMRRYRELFKFADFLIVEGPKIKEKLIELGCTPKKIKIIRIGIDVGIPPKKKNKKLSIVFAGRLVEKKGIMDALKVINLLKKEVKSFEFIIIGDGPLRKNAERFIKRNRLQEVVKILGEVPYFKYLEVLSGAGIYFQPSHTAKNGDSEGGAPTTIIEAQAMGVPVVSTYHADIPFVTIPKKTALLSKEHDILDMSRNLKRLILDVNLRKRMGKEGAKFVKTHHDIKETVKKIEKVYRELLK